MKKPVFLTPEVKGLYDLGFAVHLLQRKSKQPLENKWSTGGRKRWEALQSNYDPGMNVGVRLGSPSKLKGGYLAVIDCDVKSSSPVHAAEMLGRLRELFSYAVLNAPQVLSGRGNGSSHIYVVTKEPARARRLGQASEKVKVLMPSAQNPSRVERETLTDEEIRAGYRIRPAWEISIMGEGQQVVLPPSIHPDSGRTYLWKKSPLDGRPLPVLMTEGTEPLKREDAAASVFNFKPEEVDLAFSDVPPRIVAQIYEGEDVSDRSSALLGASNALFKAGLTENQVLSVLTDPEAFLGAATYEHARTESRGRAAHWLKRYTVSKSKKETQAEEIFRDELMESKIEPSQIESQLQDLVPEVLDWREKIERGSPESGARPKNTLKNVLLILQGEGGKEIFKRDEFANSEIYGRTPPWGGLKGAEIADVDTVRIKTWLAEKFRFEPSNDRINEAVMKIADTNRFHPVRDYLGGLEWDGVPRIDTWLKDYLEAEADEPYLSAISRKVLVAMVKRVYEPGCKFDHVLILENVKQGVGKSTTVRSIAGDQWYSDATINVGDKDAILTMRSIWVIEMGELSGMRKADVDQLKEFISRTTDRIRVPYGKRTENFPRQCIFVGTTNSEEYLRDTTGNRRFWPVKVGACDFKAVARDRDQLLAEARFAYELGEPLYLEDPEMDRAAIKEQAGRGVYDAWEDVIGDWIAKGDSDDSIEPRISRSSFRTEDLFGDGGPLAGRRLDPPELKRASEALRKLGYRSESIWDKPTGRSRRFWVRVR